MNTTFHGKKAIIIGAGPAGLTAAYELLKRTNIVPIILEKSGDIGGISKTINYRGNRIDIGGHRFFSKSDRVMKWWLDIMPIETEMLNKFNIGYHQQTREIDANNFKTQQPAGQDSEKVMLVRQRLSRIYFLRKFFSYPIQLSIDTLTKLGLWTTMAIMFSYLKAQLLPRKPENNLEDFMVNRFGTVLYKLFFKDYTEKVWGIACKEISAEWGAQRIKGVSISKALQHAVQSTLKRKRKEVAGDISQKNTETSLIEQFLYPKYGPGQLWEEVARQVEQMGGKILMHHDVKRIYSSEDQQSITAVAAINQITGETSYLEGDYFFSTMPVQELIGGLDGSIPDEVKHVASGLQYRDFITVGILLRQLSYQDKKTGEWKHLDLKDTWIYIQEKEVTVGRLQIFNNWSPHMVKDPSTTWIGMEFFCNQTDNFWKKTDEEIKRLAIQELEKIGLASQANVLDSTVIRVEKTYPAYFGTYDKFDILREFINRFENLFLVGRNGMHKYNNSDHSMLTAMVAVDNICSGITGKANIWSINTEQEYHEEKQESSAASEEVIGEPMPFVGRQPASQTFTNFIAKNKWNYLALWIASAGLLIQFIIFKFLYPQAGFLNGDSYVYLESAFWNFDINTYPVGYSKFLRLFSVFSRSDLALVAFQYFSLSASLLFLLYSLFYYFKPGKVVSILLLVCVVFNPVLLYVSNYVSSDCLFLTLSILWFTILIHIIYQPSPKLIVLHGMVLFLAFTVRYNALYYPIITGVAIILSSASLRGKLTTLLLPLLLIGLFIFHTTGKYNELAKQPQFTPFSGWQLANNAINAYRFVDNKERLSPPNKFKELDKMVRTYIDTTRSPLTHPEEQWMANTIYMWTPDGPLNRYMNLMFKSDSTAGRLRRWATVAPFYAEYGSYIIRQYPEAFFRYYLIPNTLKYCAPPVEFLEYYNMGVDSVGIRIQDWFGYKSSKVRTYFKDLKVNVLNFFPSLAAIANIILLLGLLCFKLLNGHRLLPAFSKMLILVFSLWVVNFCFSVFSAPIALRFQLFPIMVFFSFSFLLVEFIWKRTQNNV